MASFQTIVEELLLTTGASRAMLQLADCGGSFRHAAEAVRHGARQIRNDVSAHEGIATQLLQNLGRESGIVAHENIEQSGLANARALMEAYGARAQVLAPLRQGARSVGLLSLHDTREPRQWKKTDIEAMGKARAAVTAKLDEYDSNPLADAGEDLKNAALQAILDKLRTSLGVQRCTLRQNVSKVYAFPVTHESRSEGTWSLLGDFTIIQTGQPVIQKMLSERCQVVQNDTRSASSEPLFHAMLKHYGDMRSQIVTPLFNGNDLVAVLSIHQLKKQRTWKPEEMRLARSSVDLIGAVIGVKS
jgi:GAF domain-containing protein